MQRWREMDESGRKDGWEREERGCEQIGREGGGEEGEGGNKQKQPRLSVPEDGA